MTTPMQSVCCLVTVSLALILPAIDARAERPAPDLAEVAYGPHSRNVLDLWKAESDQPTPSPEATKEQTK